MYYVYITLNQARAIALLKKNKVRAIAAVDCGMVKKLQKVFYQK